MGGDPLGDLEAVEVGEVDVEQHEVGVQPQASMIAVVPSGASPMTS